ncbi:uncharacterized protein TRIADDRAFT_29321 [Trichoplax adhaerens]|uniref:Uncharacterized protein n=1 Tax=Trichoplax adhaerens TaxID=10228 RepID=B3S4S7_TRIAD|nr:hypothetical protein TRIADDRAFT_29321 [Trichoplax adhaerens]EDV22138.1 hypothetical protein TRIADDRAFT_29321 [Trichoplax adhaerens]|eukprot:XP_002115293.1 hypothetical protein TRIADDRAFT_29321 [Trichoplax adhaerens]
MTSLAPFFIALISVFLIVAFVHNRYGNWKTHNPLVSVITFVAWYFSFIIITILPLDVASTYYCRCLFEKGFNSCNNATVDACIKPWMYVPPDILHGMWLAVYWSSQLLTWIILPFMASFCYSGEFTIRGKFKAALYTNAIYYGTFLLIFIPLVIYVLARLGFDNAGEKLKVIGITASNTWGLFLLVLLLGYGLVEVPRSIWQSSRRGYKLSVIQFQIAKMTTDKEEAQEGLETVVSDIAGAASLIRRYSPLYENMKTILSKCPEELRQKVDAQRTELEDKGNANELQDIPTMKSLVKLHSRLILANQKVSRANALLQNLYKRGFELEDIIQNETNTTRQFASSFDATYQGRCKTFRLTCEWYWKVKMLPWVLKLISVILVITTIAVIWSECTFFTLQPTLSIFALLIDVAQRTYNFFDIELICLLTIGFMCLCAYYTVFRIRLFNYYYIAPHHLTNETSLLFSGTLFCRLTPPLCLNFLGLIHLDSALTGDNDPKLPETQFTAIMGHLKVLSFLASGFYIYYPITVVIFCLATYLKLGTRVLHFLGFQQFFQDDTLSTEFLNEGKQLLRMGNVTLLFIALLPGLIHDYKLILQNEGNENTKLIETNR